MNLATALVPKFPHDGDGFSILNSIGNDRPLVPEWVAVVATGE